MNTAFTTIMLLLSPLILIGFGCLALFQLIRQMNEDENED